MKIRFEQSKESCLCVCCVTDRFDSFNYKEATAQPHIQFIDVRRPFQSSSISSPKYLASLAVTRFGTWTAWSFLRFSFIYPKAIIVAVLHSHVHRSKDLISKFAGDFSVMSRTVSLRKDNKSTIFCSRLNKAISSWKLFCNDNPIWYSIEHSGTRFYG